MKYIAIDDKHRLDNLRKKATRRGLRLSKSTWRHHTLDNWGGVMIVHNGIVVDGDRYSLTLDAAEDFIDAATKYI